MRLSARGLGKHFNVNSQEMNIILKKLGYLSGTPGDYSLTEKGLLFGEEKDFHRGNGGYSWYNRYWSTRTYDDSIIDDMHVTPDLIGEAKEEVKRIRADRISNILADRKVSEEAFIKNQELNDLELTEKEKSELKLNEIKEAFIRNRKSIIYIAGSVIVLYGGYKVISKVKKRVAIKKYISAATYYTINKDAITHEGYQFNIGDSIIVMKSSKSNVWVIKNGNTKHQYYISKNFLSEISDYNI